MVKRDKDRLDESEEEERELLEALEAFFKMGLPTVG
jgi:hypothetical protein